MVFVSLGVWTLPHIYSDAAPLENSLVNNKTSFHSACHFPLPSQPTATYSDLPNTIIILESNMRHFSFVVCSVALVLAAQTNALPASAADFEPVAIIGEAVQERSIPLPLAKMAKVGKS